MKQALLAVLFSLVSGVLYAQHISSNEDELTKILPQRSFPRKEPRILTNVSALQYPRPGECRIWYPDRVNGLQPPPVKCESLIGIMLNEGAFILHSNGKAYDAEYDWKKDRNKEREKERNGKVPQAIIDILFGPTEKI